MLKKRTNEPTRQKPLRLWPGVVIVVLQWLAGFVVPQFGTDAAFYGVIGGIFGGGLAFLVWWLFFSRAAWSERLGALALMIVSIFAARQFLHVSVATGNVGMQYVFYTIPLLSLAFVVCLAASRRLSDGPRRAAMAGTIMLACAALTFVRSEGLKGDGSAEFVWRWSETSEERLLVQASDEPLPLPSGEATAETEPDWPGFRGHDRDGIIAGLRIETDWSASPPVELWRRPIGPGWASFAVHGNLLYTQEQRGDDEVVACYKMTTGEPVWRHRDAARFWDSYVGVGPRATPALANGRLYTYGATGIMNALDAANGEVVWSRKVPSDTDAKLPFWGFCVSPLVLEEVVIVHSRKLVAYDLATGEPRWFGPTSGESYGSPHLLTIDGVDQIVLLIPTGATSIDPTNGTLLWEHSWPGIGIVQPALIPNSPGGMLISMINDMAVPIGTRRIAVEHQRGGWIIEERWTSTQLKPSFSSVVVHKGHVFGFDGRFLACIDVDDGKRKWKGGRYGSGQLVLLPDQDLLVVLSEKGEVALVQASPDRFTELARLPAIKGKTWSQPTLVGDVLLVRNGQEMAAFRLTLATAERS